MDRPELASCLRAWRERLPPEAAGLPAGGRRRTPGLRREELAGLAGVSVDYLNRLEQGRAAHPSPQVLGALARALRLTDDEHAHLFRVAGQAPPGPERVDRRLTPGVQRVLDRLADLPVIVVDPAWTIVAWNPLAAALMGDFSARTERERNTLWGHFTGAPSRVERTAQEEAAFEVEAVGALHAAVGRHPEDPGLRALVADLQAASEPFRRLWDTRSAGVHAASRKTFNHPEVGRLTLDCDVLEVAGSDLRLVVHSAAPGTPDASALALLGVVGLQRI